MATEAPTITSELNAAEFADSLNAHLTAGGRADARNTNRRTTMTLQDRTNHDVYVGMSDEDKQAVRDCYEKVIGRLQYLDYAVAGDDRAESLVAAIARYIEDCRSE